jgi:hypothetical protein
VILAVKDNAQKGRFEKAIVKEDIGEMGFCVGVGILLTVTGKVGVEKRIMIVLVKNPSLCVELLGMPFHPLVSHFELRPVGESPKQRRKNNPFFFDNGHTKVAFTSKDNEIILLGEFKFYAGILKWSVGNRIPIVVMKCITAGEVIAFYFFIVIFLKRRGEKEVALFSWVFGIGGEETIDLLPL